ncbi:MAG: penicillin-binding protein activator [Mixta calida]|uniref:penicillin-binding protein activator n=1 Tax=Mixta calida TaxID=665913 RepID=UPI000535C818|nr:penicillin-binding protein activator [Mixta calida]AIX72447.1 penicillin-binding protein [Pantoea sp. PSNIH2]MBS6057372.1 penicillin-binding protein activator [Pantoea sp.]POU47526.1 penicillin-binding protein activator [Pantoea sp. PSNIH5]POU66141.1 penicillin-binding protein activator [Pantoea sp. PSNIH4]POY67999.1 penicillin-binding protein activator [Pantoea sp. PSNIH3]HCW46286.1 penicillin-binding protein activator [Erwiniaceae bacterium]
MLPSKVVRKKAGRFVPVLLAGLILAACTGQGPQAPAVNVQGPATGTSDYYLQQVQQSPDDNKADWQLLAIRALLNEGKYPQANQQMSQLPQQLSDVQRLELQLLTAQLRLGGQDIATAQEILAKLDPAAMSKDQQQRYYGLKIAASQGRPSLDLVRALIAQEPLLSDKAQQDNIDATWQALQQLPPEQMSSLVINADENTLQGWLDLLSIYKANRTDPDMLKAGISDWQTRYPQNPAAKTLPTALGQVQNFQPASTGKIALLLPLSGQAQVFASAIQKGFNDAKNGLLNAAPASAIGSAQNPVSLASGDAQSGAGAADNAQNVAAPASDTQNADANAVVSPSAVPADNADAQPQAAAPTPASVSTAPASNAEVKVYDTSSQPIQQVLAQAQQDGATLVVGPLLKSSVQQVADASTPLNVLALNEPETIQNHPNLCYFALSPEDEARDAAHHIWQQGKRMPLMLVPRSSLGDRVSKAFAQEWQTLGGGTVLQQSFGSTAELKQGINSGAGISLSGTPVAAAPSEPQGVTIAGLTIPAPQSSAPTEAAASSGGSVDAVYIVATQSELQLIKPMIAMRVSSRSNVALYASSRSFQAGAGPDFRLEMEGLQFSDIPLLSGANPGLMQQAARSFNNDYSLVRLYAMGIDAWTLANHFSEMRQMPGFHIDGNTGQLSATQDCVINRKLTWSQYRQGQVVPAS